MKRNFIYALSFVSVLSVNALADSRVVGHPEPFEHELLPQPISLTGACSNVKIVEWREYVRNDFDVKVVDDTCNLTYKKWYKFMAMKGYKITKKVKPSYKLSLIPFDPFRNGARYRGLNDFYFRFSEVQRMCLNDTNENGEHDTGETYYKCPPNDFSSIMFGAAFLKLKRIFVRNDPTLINNSPNTAFQAVFSHELAHELSYETGVRSQYSDDPDMEEKLAFEFSEWLGFGSIVDPYFNKH